MQNSSSPGRWGNLRRAPRWATLAFALLLAATLAQSAMAGYCALAYSKSTGRWGSSYGHATRAAAEARALRECGTNDAFIAGWGRNRYIALAVGPGGAWGFSSGSTQRQAERGALRMCPSPHARILRVAYSFD